MRLTHCLIALKRRRDVMTKETLTHCFNGGLGGERGRQAGVVPANLWAERGLGWAFESSGPAGVTPPQQGHT